MIYPANVLKLSERIGEHLTQLGWTITAAESCTGGLLAGALTAVAGSSAWFDGSLVTYSNRVKTDLAGVPEGVINEHGAVSQHTVEAMALGAAQAMRADVAVAISGIAGPEGGVIGKPVGTVWMAIALPGQAPTANRHHYEGDRQMVREQAVFSALRATLESLQICGGGR